VDNSRLYTFTQRSVTNGSSAELIGVISRASSQPKSTSRGKILGPLEWEQPKREAAIQQCIAVHIKGGYKRQSVIDTHLITEPTEQAPGAG
jgi:hypothetical protein